MRVAHLFVALFLTLTAACGSSTAPGGAKDPSLLFTNNLDSSWVYITWRDGQVIEGRDSIAPRTRSQCVRFLAQPDSAYWTITAHENGGLATATAPYFNPASRPAWSVVVNSVGSVGSPSILVSDIDPALAC